MNWLVRIWPDTERVVAEVVHVDHGADLREAVEVEVFESVGPPGDVGLPREIRPEIHDALAPLEPLIGLGVLKGGLEDDEVAVQVVGDARPPRVHDPMLAAVAAVGGGKVEAVEEPIGT